LAKSRSPPFSAEPGILGVLLRQVLELRAGLELGDDGLGLVFLLDQDVADAVFGAARLGLELVVFGLDLGVGDRRLLVDVGGEQADQDALAGDLHLLLEVVRGAEAAALGFLDQDLVGDDLVADQLVDVRRQLLAAGGGLLLHLGDDRVGARLRHRLAVDDGDVLGLGGQRGEPGAGDGSQSDAGGEKTLLHDEREPFGL
jgi:hypothetical protein